MILSKVAPEGAVRHGTTRFRAVGAGVLASLLVPLVAASQPVLPQGTFRPASAASARAAEAQPPFAPPSDTAVDRENDPYPGTRRAGEIDRLPEFTTDVLGWVALGRVVWSSGYDQVAKSPKTWPRTGESYGRRFATRSAQLVTIEAVRHGLAAALDRDPAYVRCACTGFGARLGHVTKGVVTDFDTDGMRRVGWPRFAGALAGAAMLGQLQPGQGRAGTVAYRAVTTVAGSFLGNAVKELGWFGASDAKRPGTP
jgi:hypothetical protein